MSFLYFSIAYICSLRIIYKRTGSHQSKKMLSVKWSKILYESSLHFSSDDDVHV